MKIFRIVAGTLGGGMVTGLCFAAISWIVIFNSNPGFGVEGPNPYWAHLAAVLGGFMGFVMGLPLGLLITLLKQDSIVGAFLGLLGGGAIAAWASQTGGSPDVVYPTVPLLISFVPAGALSGFLTSHLVSRFLDSLALNTNQ